MASKSTRPYSHFGCVQEQFFQLWKRETTSAAYNTNLGLHLAGPLSLPMLQAALNRVVQRHEVRLLCADGPSYG